MLGHPTDSDKKRRAFLSHWSSLTEDDIPADNVRRDHGKWYGGEETCSFELSARYVKYGAILLATSQLWVRSLATFITNRVTVF